MKNRLRRRLPLTQLLFQSLKQLLMQPLTQRRVIGTCLGAALLMTAAGCAALPESARQALALPRLTTGVSGAPTGRFQLGPGTVVHVAQPAQPDQRLYSAVLLGLQRVFPRTALGGLDQLAAAETASVTIFVDTGPEPVAWNSSLADLPWQAGFGPTLDLQLTVTCIDRGSGVVLDHSGLVVRRRWFSSKADLQSRVTDLLESYARALRSG